MSIGLFGTDPDDEIGLEAGIRVIGISAGIRQHVGFADVAVVRVVDVAVSPKLGLVFHDERLEVRGVGATDLLAAAVIRQGDRLLVAVHFDRGMVYTLRFFTHAEYKKRQNDSMKKILTAACATITASLRGDVMQRNWKWTFGIQAAYLSCLIFSAHLATRARRVGRLVGTASEDYVDASRAASIFALAGACLVLAAFLAGVRPASGYARVIWILEFALILAVPPLLQ